MSAPTDFRPNSGRKRSADDHSDELESSKMHQYFERVKMAKAAAQENRYRKSVQELDEAVRVAKRGRVLSYEEEKRLRRYVSNRRSIRKAKLKRSQYIDEMEKKITQLEEGIGYLKPEVQNVKQANTKLEIENLILQEKLKKWTDHNISVDAQIEMRMAQIRMLEMKNIIVTNPTEIQPVPESCTGIFRRPEQDIPVEDTELYLGLDALCDLTYL